MPVFHYIATKKDNSLVEGDIEAQDRNALLEDLYKKELFPVSIEVKKSKQKMDFKLNLFQRVSALDKIVLTRDLSIIIKSGIGLKEALEILEEDTEKPLLRQITFQIRSKIEKGQPLSAGFAMFPEYFPPFFINLIRAGEASGNLDEVLDDLSLQMKKEYELRRKVVSAMIYPIVLMVSSVFVLGIILIVVLPKLSKVFDESHVKLPFMTKGLIWLSNTLSGHFLEFLLIVIALVVMSILFGRSGPGKKFYSMLYSKMPLIKSLQQKIAMTHFSSVLHILLKSAIPFTQALEITADSIGSKSYRKAILDMNKEEIQKGLSFGGALNRKREFFPRMVISLLSVGEKTGKLEESLDILANFYEKEVDDTLKNLINTLEPLMILGMGVIVALLALSIIMPIYQMVGSF